MGRQKDDKKVELLFESTLVLVSKVGLVGLTMAMIAKEARLGTGTAYRYFPSKEALLHELYKGVKKRIEKQVFTGLALQQLPVKAAFKLVWEEYTLFIISNKNERIFLQQFNRSPFIHTPETRLFAQEVMQPLFALIERGQAEDLVKSDKSTLIFLLIAGLVDQVSNMIIENKLENEQTQLVNDAFILLWDAIKN